MKYLLSFLSLASLSFANIPAVGPDYARPTVDAPATYRDVDTSLAWKSAEPAEDFARGEWWKMFADPRLDDLEERALAANQNLRAAAARVEEARGAAGLASSSYWPQIAANGELTRERSSRTTANVFPNSLTTTYETPLTASWEIDLFGRVRRLAESARADAEASADVFESVRLALTSEVASTYFSLRSLDRELRIVRETVGLRQRALDLVNSRRKIGTAAELDSVRAEGELASAEADAAALASQRSAVQDALAVLVGTAAPGFSLPATDLAASTPPNIPAGLPAALLERRPDVVAAERALAAANARIGVAKAAFFPAISLTGSAGFASDDLGGLLRADSRLWSIGPRLYLPIFQGGRNRANLERSRAAFDEAVAAYRQRVLVAFREVQDALTASQFLTAQSVAQERALAAARRAADLAQVRYAAGYVSYFEVIDAQRTSLSTERASAKLAALRLNTSVALIQALGGGWQGPDRRLPQ